MTLEIHPYRNLFIYTSIWDPSPTQRFLFNFLCNHTCFFINAYILSVSHVWCAWKLPMRQWGRDDTDTLEQVTGADEAQLWEAWGSCEDSGIMESHSDQRWQDSAVRAEGGCIAVLKIKHFLWVMGGQICQNTELNTYNHKHTLTFRWIQARGYIIALFSSNSLFRTKYISLNDLNH